MIIGLGIDITPLERIERAYQRNARFAKRILTTKEYEKFITCTEKEKIRYLAGRFSVKESFSKAYGTGIGAVRLQDIETLSDSRGKPITTVKNFSQKIHVSISHSDTDVISQVILEDLHDNCN
ncbi:holo-ACP synthase [Holzapfeliella sp. He02]|uniref:Holo-[acyl-carrier-protein] synthase n=1 Tax=Holzapfeliella saturejae TaxID=3082953 RepID=A0ABU8SFA8_9LACO